LFSEDYHLINFKLMNQSRLAYLFQRYTDKVCTDAELNEFLSILSNDKKNAEMEIILDKYWEHAPEIELNPQTSKEILDKTLSARNESSKNIRLFSFKWISWVAAVILIGFAVWRTNQDVDGQKSQLSKDVAEVASSAAGNEIVTVSTSDEHQKITLPDSSTVILNSKSSISYPKFFAADRRDVTLQGEGYFDIKHNKSKPFSVTTGTLVTRVLGTAFNIKAYNGDQNIAVTVTRGKVGVTKGNSTLGILLPNQQIVFNTGRQKLSVNKVIASEIVRWKDSDIFFDDTSMGQAMELLSRKFATPIAFSNPAIKDCKFSATFLKGESLKEILEVVCSFNNAQYSYENEGVIISGIGCGNN